MGPILGAILAAGLYEYLYCPDPELKRRLKQVFQKDSSGKYKEVETSVYMEDAEIQKHGVDVESTEKKDPFQSPTGEASPAV